MKTRDLSLKSRQDAPLPIINSSNDLFQACMMHGVTHLGIAVRNIYHKSNDFERAHRFFETLYASNRLTLPLEGILLVGY